MQETVEVVRVLDTKTTGTNDFKTRILHGKTNEQYPQVLELQFNQGNVTLLDSVAPGQKLRIDFNLKGREWTNAEGVVSVFNSLVAWKIEKLT